MHRVKWVGVFAAVLLVLTGAAAACTPADIQIKQWSWKREAGWVTVVGELANTCADPTGVQMQLTFRDGSGAVVDVDESWLTGTRNLAPGETYPFKRQVRAYATTKDTSIRVIGVRRWDSAK